MHGVMDGGVVFPDPFEEKEEFLCMICAVARLFQCYRFEN